MFHLGFPVECYTGEGRYICYEQDISKTHRPSKNIVKNVNKKSTEEKREDARIRKQISRDKLKEKYGDEEYKKQRAKELADYRK